MLLNLPRWPMRLLKDARSHPRQGKYGLRARDLASLSAEFIPFLSSTRMSGINLDSREVRKGAPEAIAQYAAAGGHRVPKEIEEAVRNIANAGGTPLLVANDRRVLGAIYLKDIVKGACANGSINFGQWESVPS